MTFSVSPTDFFINAPFSQLEEGLIDLFVCHGLQPEIGLEGDSLYTTEKHVFAKVASTLAKNNLSCTLHAPFFDLAPGALDPYILSASREKLQRAFDLISLFKPRLIVCHLNFESNKHSYKQAEWFAHAYETWTSLLQVAELNNTTVAFENTYETDPQQHLAMLSALDSQLAGFCFDTGHVLAFAKNSWRQWTSALEKIVHLHLHDNHGDIDAHLAIGRGAFDFRGLFKHLNSIGAKPTVTIEPHSQDDLWFSLARLREMGVIPHSENK